MLICGALGVSNLVALLNNGRNGTQPTQANNLGPFWRDGAPHCADAASLLRSPVVGAALFFKGHVRDMAGNPVARADLRQGTGLTKATWLHAAPRAGGKVNRQFL